VESSSSDGVVGALRVPDRLREPVERAWREAHPIARAFVLLTIGDVLLRALGILEPTFGNLFADPLALVGTFVPRDAWLLLPAILLLRRPDAAIVTPWIVWSAVAIALVEFVSIPLRSMIGTVLPNSFAVSLWLAILASLVLAVARATLARGLSALNVARPSETIAGLANLVAIGVGVQLVLGLAVILTAGQTGIPDIDRLVPWSAFANLLALAAWGAVAWTIVRAFGDESRPEWALILATAGAVLSGIVGIFGSIGAVLAQGLGASAGTSALSTVGAWATFVLGPGLVVAGFAFGLGEPATPYVPPEPTPPPEASSETEGAAAPELPGDEAPAAEAPAAELPAAEGAEGTGAPAAEAPAAEAAGAPEAPGAPEPLADDPSPTS